MAWFLSSTEIKSMFGSLGKRVDHMDNSENCLGTLETIIYNLKSEDATMRNFRRAVWFGQHVKNDLLPLIINTKEFKILNTTIKILVDLTSPIGCLLAVEVVAKDQHCTQVLFELEKLLITSKEAFVTPDYTKAVIDFMQRTLEEDIKLSPLQCQSINNGLLLLRNILHISETSSAGGCNKTTLQNQILRNLFTQNINKLLLHLMSCGQRSNWSVALVQLIALIYKDQSVGVLQSLLNVWYETSISESSDDNESNTTPKLQSSGDTSPTSDQTSDSSDNGFLISTNIDEKINSVLKGTATVVNITEPRKFKPKAATAALSAAVSMTSKSPRSEISDCGYGTQLENQESISTSSNEDEYPLARKPVHKKPPPNKKQRFNAANNIRSTLNTPYKNDAKRKKIIKRSRTNMKIKCAENCDSAEFDITSILKDFTVDFLLQGYDKLVRVLHTQLLSESFIEMDKSHFFWLVTYFLKFSAQLEIDLDYVSSVFSYDIISYLTYEGVTTCEELELLILQPGSDFKPCLRRMHLIVIAIREFLQALETYKKGTHLNSKDKTQLKNLQIQITKTEDMRHLFILLIRCFNSSFHNRKYLQDLIVTNHIFLIMCDNTAQLTNESSIMTDHVSQFATVEIMQFYGMLLEDYQENGDFVNECIFTMMHHVSGDLNSMGLLFQPKIIKTFLQIWESGYQVGEDWKDLVEFVVHEVVCKRPKLSLPFSAEPMVTDAVNASESSWNQKDTDDIFCYYFQTKQSGDWVENIVQLFQVNGKHVTRINVIEHLFKENVISQLQFDDMMKFEQPSILKSEPKYLMNDKRSIEMRDSTTKLSDDIQVLQDRLVKENKSNLLQWIQNILLECVHVKLNSANKINYSTLKYIKMAPVVYHCILKKVAIPIVPWTAEHTRILRYQPFVLLLRKLGFHLPTATNVLYVRIPEYWTVGVLYNVAGKLGPLDKSKIKFEFADLKRTELCGEKIKSKLANNDLNLGMFNAPSSNLMTGFAPESNPSSNWLSLVTKNKNIISDKSLEESGSRPVYIFSSPNAAAPSAPSNKNSRAFNYPVSSVIAPAPAKEEDEKISISDIEQHAMEHDYVHEDVEIVSTCSCDTASVASDLTRMYVSDVEDKNYLLPAI